MKKKRLIAFLLALFQLSTLLSLDVNGENANDSILETTVIASITYLRSSEQIIVHSQEQEFFYPAEFVDIMQTVNTYLQFNDVNDIISSLDECLYEKDIRNNEELSKYLLIEELRNNTIIS